MNIKEFHYFHKLVEDKNFSQVASFFNVSQPTITMAIKRLESELGVKLFVRDRSHKQLVVTPSGEQLDRHVTQILNELEVMKKELLRISSEKVMFGLPPIIGTYYFPHVAPELLRAGLIDKLDIFESGSNEMLNYILDGTLDLALIGSITPIVDTKLDAKIFERTHFKIAVSENHPLAKQDSVKFKELAQEKFIILDDRFIHSVAFNKMCHANQFRPQIIHRSNDVHILKAMIKENMGISFLTELALPPEKGIKVLDIADSDQPEFLLSIVYRRSHTLTKLQQSLLEILPQKINL